jgi:hypothetical protein
LPIDTAVSDFEAQLLVRWRRIEALSTSFTADRTRGKSGQGTVDCVVWEDDMARVDRRELAHRFHHIGDDVFPMLG